MAKRARHDTSDAEWRSGEPEIGNSIGDGKANDAAIVADSGGDGAIVEPSTVAGGTGDSDPVRKRRADAGRKRGPRGEKTDKIDLGEFAEILSEVHSFLAFISSVPEFALDETVDEHNKMARAFSRVARHYDIPVLDPIVRDWIMLFKTLALIYGAHFMAYNERQRGNRAKNVTPLAPAGRSAPLGTAPGAEGRAQNGAAEQGPIVKKVVVPGFEHIGPVDIKVG
jgi:hypothetical protein